MNILEKHVIYVLTRSNCSGSACKNRK